MFKKELIEAIAKDTTLTKIVINDVLESLSNQAERTLAAGEEFTLPGIGKLSKGSRSARIGRNPQTGAQIQIEASSTVKFKVSSTLKSAVQ